MLIIFSLNSVAYAQTPPTLSCGGSSLRHDWDVNTWPAGSLSNSYTTTGETLSVTISGDTGFFQPNTSSAPVTSNFDTGGLTPAELSLELFVDFPTVNEGVIITFNVGTAGIGVQDLQFSIFDVDFGAAQFQDQLTITGSLGGSPVSPILTAGVAHTVSGSVATGQTSAESTSSDGTLVTTFTAPIDQFSISYTNGPSAPAAPGVQAVSLHDIFTCPRLVPVIDANKAVAVYDPDNAGLYNIPGNDVIYTISASNTGTGPTDTNTIVLIDSLPPEITFYNGDIDDAGPEIHAVKFTKSDSPSLAFDFARDVKFSDAASKPASFADCNYTPAAGYDANVTFICLNPKGALDAGSPTPTFSVQFRAQIN